MGRNPWVSTVGKNPIGKDLRWKTICVCHRAMKLLYILAHAKVKGQPTASWKGLLQYMAKKIKILHLQYFIDLCDIETLSKTINYISAVRVNFATLC